MAKTLRVIGEVAAVVAILTPIVGPAIGLGAKAVSAISSVAASVSAVATAGSAALQKPPEAQGSINEVIIGANMPVPYAMGRTYVGGNKIFDASADGPGGHPNKDRTQIFVGSHAGPIEGFEQFLADYSPIDFATESGGLISGVASGFYGADGGYMWLNTRKGLRPDTALTQPSGRTAFTGWTSAHKLSGMASWSVTMEFDEDGVRFSGGIPAFGMVAKWVWAYDPRLDSTYPGGSGSQRWDDESTWAWTDNPPLHALTYARGRFMGASNVKVVGCGIPKTAIDIAAFVNLANICDANGWTLGGTIYEGPGLSKWDNLKRILDAAAAKPVWAMGVLTLTISAPKTALDTITKDAILEGDEPIPAMNAWKDRFNTIVPRYRSEDHRWEYVEAAAVVESTYLAEDGESKTDTRQYDLIQDKDQAAQRAAYDLVNEREYGPFTLPLKPHMRVYQTGEALNVDLADIFDDDDLTTQLCTIIGRTIDPATGSVQLEFMSETSSKHAYALGQTGVAPPTPTIVPPEDVDQAVHDGRLTVPQITALIDNSRKSGLSFSIDDTGHVSISDYTCVYSDKNVTVEGLSSDGSISATRAGSVATGGTDGDLVYIFYDDEDRLGGAVTFQFLKLAGGTGDDSSAGPSTDHPYRHFVCAGYVPPTGGSTGGGSGAGSGGGAGGEIIGGGAGGARP